MDLESDYEGMPYLIHRDDSDSEADMDTSMPYFTNRCHSDFELDTESDSGQEEMPELINGWEDSDSKLRRGIRKM